MLLRSACACLAALLATSSAYARGDTGIYVMTMPQAVASCIYARNEVQQVAGEYSFDPMTLANITVHGVLPGYIDVDQLAVNVDARDGEIVIPLAMQGSPLDSSFADRYKQALAKADAACNGTLVF